MSMATQQQLPEDFFAYILKSIPSGSDFKTHSPLIFSWLSQGSKTFADKLLKDILVILEDAQYPPASKFYAVLLLLKGTEISKGSLASRLAKQRHLLDKMFKDAQFDKQKEFERRGRKFFSRNPTEEQAVLGVNYVRLVLEAIVYWYKIFGTGNIRDPLYIFTLMYNNLSTLLTLPQVFYYAAREFTVSDGFHLKHFLTLTDDPICLENSSKKNIEEAEEELDRDQIFNDVIACISSVADFKTNSPVVFQDVAKNSWPYNKVLLQTLNSILTGSGYPPEFKFYALLLAVRLSEMKNDIFVQHLGEERTFMESVLKNAQFEKDKSASERGKTFFKANPSPKEAIAGKNFVTLSREAVYLWATYAEMLSKKASKEGVLRLKSACGELVLKLELTGDYVFIGNPSADDVDSFLRKFSEEATKNYQGKAEKEVTKPSNPAITTRRDNAQKYARRAEEHLKTCIAADGRYKESSLVIHNALQQNIAEYSKALLANIEQILTSNEKTYQQKYYTLFLLAEITKTEDRSLLKQLEEAQSLLEILFMHAEAGLERLKSGQKKTSQPSQETEDDTIICAYGRLVCEAIICWNSLCAEDSKTKFRMMYEALNQNNKGLPQDFMFIEEKMEIDPQEALERFTEERMQKQLEEQKIQIDELKAKLDRLADVKARFKKALEENEGAIFKNMRIVDSMMKEFTQVYHKEVLLNANLLIDNNVRGSERFVQRAVLEGDVFEKVSRAYLDYKQQILKYPWFRTEVIKILGDQSIEASAETSQAIEMSRVEAQEALDKRKERVEEVILASEKASIVVNLHEDKQKSEENSSASQTEKHQRTPGHMIIDKDGEDLTSAWVYMSGEGETSSKREISSILNADEDKRSATPSTPKRKMPVYSPALEFLKENPSVSNWVSKVNNTETSVQRNNRTETSSEERTETEEEEEESNVISYSAYEAIITENRKLREANQELFKENCLMKKHIEENKEQAKLEEASQALEGMRGILLEAQAEMEELYRELHTKSEESKHYRRRCDKLEQEIRFYRENAELRGKLDGLSSDMHELKKCMIEKSANATRNENEELMRRLKELEEKNGNLTKVLEDIQEKNSIMTSKMQELEELQTIATTYRQNTSRFAAVERDFMFESKGVQSRENVLETEEAGSKQIEQQNEKEEPEKSVATNIIQNTQENENQICSTPRENAVEKRGLSNQSSPLRLLSANVNQNKSPEGKKEQFSLQISPHDKELEAKGSNQSSFSFPKRYYSLQISKCFLPENNDEHDLSTLSVDVKNCLPQNSHALNIEGLGLNIENKKQH